MKEVFDVDFEVIISKCGKRSRVFAKCTDDTGSWEVSDKERDGMWTKAQLQDLAYHEFGAGYVVRRVVWVHAL